MFALCITATKFHSFDDLSWLHIVKATTLAGQPVPHEKYIVSLLVFVGSRNGEYAFLISIRPL